MWKEHTNSKTQVCVWRHRRIHGLSCSKSAGRISRHRGLNAIILRALTAIHMHPTLEPVGISRNNGKRPDGATMGAWSKGQKLLWDATCVDTLAQSYVNRTSQKGGAAAEIAC
uniref:Uncharacterized protein n=1 Tax=Cacopsylla melanoneura TaxID=428564 RepID=A0A8D8YXV9_9HEMI